MPSSQHFSVESSDRAVANRTGFRVGLACLLVLLAGLVAAAGLIYFLSGIFAGWVADV